MKRAVSILITCVLGALCVLGGCGKNDSAAQKQIRKVNSMPSVIANYKLMDFEAKAKEFDRVVFAFTENEEYVPMDRETYAPIGFWDSSASVIRKYGKKAFGLPAYVGHSTNTPGNSEGIATIPAVLGGALVGIDETDRNGHDLVDMLSIYYNDADGMITDGINQATGASFWYELYNQISYAKLGYIYPKETTVLSRTVSMADRWLESIPYFRLANGTYNFEYTAFRFSSMQPYNNGKHKDSPNAGMAYLMLMAYALTGNEKYIDGATLLMDYLEESPNSFYYEMIQDYAPLVMAKLNFEFGKNYNVQRFIDQAFDGDSLLRPGWGAIAEDAGNYSFHGLVGTNETNPYAFLMNSYHLAAALAPVVKYDARFASAIGKHILNAASSIRVFYPNELPAENQQHGGPFFTDPNGSIGYESCKIKFGDKTPYATGDPTQYGWGPTDYGIYGSNIAGYFGAMIKPTDVEQILQIDLNSCDFYGNNVYPHYLYYNPYPKNKKIRVDFPENSVLFDAVTNTVINKSAGKNTEITVPAENSVSIIVLPPRAEVKKENGYYVAGADRISKEGVAVSITEPSVQDGFVYGKFELKTYYSGKEKPKKFTVYIDGEKAYEGKYKNSVKINSEKYSFGSHIVEAVAETASGLKDASRIRIYFNN